VKDFITGLQFLTRLQISRETEWSPERFGRSVRYFPLVGAVIGGILAGAYYFTSSYLPVHVQAALLLALGIILTGGLHNDGFMDTADGIFSGRSRERMLEIMKDSRVGANGVISFGVLTLLKWSIYLDMPPAIMPFALFVSPVIGRFCLVVGITAYPYARPDGIGKAFAEFAGRRALYTAAIVTLFLLLPIGKMAVAALLVALSFVVWFAGYVTRLLGGLTGDVYGAITETTELLVLSVFLVLSAWV
jgi:adenosylcobinamide-GDP ribazoletransferase